MKLPKPLTQPKIWLAGFLIWLGSLWFMSANSTTIEGIPPIPFFDKVCHFGYFFGGGGLLSAYFYSRRPTPPPWRQLILIVVLTLAAVGWIDEWHQTFTPGRSGNDPGDWLADVLGGFAGALVFRRFHHVFESARNQKSS